MAGMSCVCTHLLLLGSIVQFTTVRRKVQSSGVFEILADMIASPILSFPWYHTLSNGNAARVFTSQPPFDEQRCATPEGARSVLQAR